MNYCCMKIKSNFKFILLFGIFLISSIVWNPVLAQIPPETGLSININTPAESASVPSGDLTIYGTSSDDGTKNCQVYADWNDLKPMQNVTPDGHKGNADYSKWSYTYTGSYHNIVEGSNELTSKITCFDLGQNASSQFYSINVTGTKDGSEITNNTAQQSNETTNTNKEAANILPVKDTQKSGTYKILPLYSESNEKVTNPASSKEGDKTEVTTTDTSESHDTQDSVKTDSTDAKTLSSEPQQESQASTDTSESHDTQDSVKTDSTDAKTLSSEPQQESVGTTAYDTSKSHVTKNTDKELSTDTNKYFTFEPNLHEDQKISENDNNPMNNNPDSDSSLPNHYNEGDSVFGLKMKGLGEDTKNQLDNKVQKLEERPPDHMHAFGPIG
jgi:hypothetical protein